MLRRPYAAVIEGQRALPGREMNARLFDATRFARSLIGLEAAE